MPLSDKQILIIQRINKNIERGDIGQIAKTTGFTREHVGRVLNPFSSTYTDEIINAAVELISEREQDRKEMLRKLPA